jgi:hypothetical protein
MSLKPGKDFIDPNELTFKEEPLTPVRVRAYCDCGQEGEIVSTGQGYRHFESYWVHKCKKCGAEVTIKGKSYPAIEYK